MSMGIVILIALVVIGMMTFFTITASLYTWVGRIDRQEVDYDKY